jgi:thiamine-phosphate pyrophosphorylase
MFRYAITSRALFLGDDRRRQTALVEQAARWGTAGIDFIQLREKDLAAGALADLARRILKELPPTTKLLLNSRADITIATGAYGVHLTATFGELSPVQVRQLYAGAALAPPVITVSCHTVAEAAQAREQSVDAILFAPVFGKMIAGETVTPGQGLDQLRAACAAAAPTAVYALGGVTLENAPSCLQAGAAGVAGIRLFHGV